MAENLEPNSTPRTQDVQKLVAHIWEMAKSAGTELPAALSALEMAELTHAITRVAAREQRVVFAQLNISVASEKETIKARNERRAERAPAPRWVFPVGSPLRRDGATYELGDAVKRFVELRDPRSSWFEHEERLLLCLTNDGTNYGKAVKHSLQGGTFRILNQREGTRSAYNTVLFSLCRCGRHGASPRHAGSGLSEADSGRHHDQQRSPRGRSVPLF